MYARLGTICSFTKSICPFVLPGVSRHLDPVHMNENEIQKLTAILEEVRDNQKNQLERQIEALTLQREHFSIVQRQAERAEVLQQRAEELQRRGGQLITIARTAVLVLLPIILLLLIYVSWLLFR